MTHTFRKIYYHLVWTTKYRAPLITPSIETDIRAQASERAEQFGAKQLALNMTADHVHLLVDFQAAMVLSDFVHDVKGGSSYYVNKKSAETSLRWQRGYGALTVDEDAVPIVIRYIENQKKHHANNDIWPVYEAINR